MKKDNHKSADELRPEYKRSDFTDLVRGKYVASLTSPTDKSVGFLESPPRFSVSSGLPVTPDNSETGLMSPPQT